MTTLVNDSGLFKINLSNTNEPPKSLSRNVHVFMEGNDVKRLEALKDRIYPHTKKAVLLNSLQLLDDMVNEIDSGTKIYIKREGKDIEEYRVFG